MKPRPLLCMTAFALAALVWGMGGNAPAPARSYALLMGINHYEHAGLPALQFAERDVEDLAAVLDRPGSPFHGNIRVLTGTRGAKRKDDEPTAANIRKSLHALVENRCYQSGRGVEKNEKEAVVWYRKAAAQNYSYAQYNLGCCYLEGIGVVKNRSEAIGWLKKAAEGGHPAARKLLDSLSKEPKKDLPHSRSHQETIPRTKGERILSPTTLARRCSDE
jgi:hypothetical protein